MGEVIDACVMGLNSIGRGFCTYAAAMFFQTGMLVAILFLLDLLLRRYVQATLRYWIWLLVFVKLLLPPSLCAPTGIGYWCGKYAPSSPSVAPQPAETAVSAPVRTEPAARIETPESPPWAAYTTPAVVEAGESAVPHGERLSWQGGVFVLWAAGVFVFGVLLMQRLLFVRGLIAQGEPAGDDLVDVLGRCRRRVGVRREVGLLLSPNAFSPAVCGFFRPVILMPARLLEKLPAHSVEAILIHELAHLKRGDIWVNCAQTVLQIIYFYNPLVWLANAMVRRVREQAVDEMVLVALGAEAKSYGRALIDIAEMAFLRASPALRLLGVAESKKSLEGRIRHMITRPIPKSANVGVTGAVAIIAIGAALLPMAAAGTKAPPPQVTANLPNGITVEFVGVCNWPSGASVCWKADGSTLDRPRHVTKWNLRPGTSHYGFMLRVTGPDDLEVRWNKIEGADSWEGLCDVVDAQGNRLEGHTAAVALVKDGAAQTALQVGFATGPWSTVSSHDGKGMSRGGRSGVLWSQMFEDGGGTSVVATAEWRKDRTERIVAIDMEGVMHAPPSGSVAQGKMHQMTTCFPSLKSAQIKEFQYQVRPYEWVEFRNVSLRPGHKTVVTVHVGAPEERTPRAGGALSGSDNATERKSYSHTCLANLGKAVLIYANDHADQLPAGIENAREYLNREEAEWLLANVVYLGKDLSPDDYPGLALAYDRTMLAEGKGTNVLYLDCHVDFENSRELERLGISSVRWDAALRTYEVNRRVADFPRAEDFSTPEAAYATINQIDRGNTMEQVKAKLGPPDEEEDRWLSYRDRYGLDFMFSPSGVLLEIRMNPKFRGRLTSGISLASSQADVFKAYGRPIEERKVDNLHRQNEHRVLFQRGDVSRIYYADEELIFWFKGDRISQMVTVPKRPTAQKPTRGN